MTSIDTAGSQVSESEISAALGSLREHFEAVHRGENKLVIWYFGGESWIRLLRNLLSLTV